MTEIENDPERLDLLAEEFAERLRRGESPSISEFVRREGGDADEIRDLLSSVAMIEQWKRQKRHERAAASGAVAPEHLGDFQILRELGRGGMGIVYEAEQSSLGRHVAVKVLPRHSLLDPSRWKRFQHEAQTAARLHHTNIVPIFGVGEHEGLHYLVMQLIDGRGIDRVLAEWKSEETTADPGRDRWERVARIGMQAAEALQYAHNQGVLHRDVKPANLLLDNQGVVWVTDFGLAKMVERESLSNSGDILGTLQYMAPERFETVADERSDIYSLGLTLYELLTLEPAFQESSPSKLIRQVSAGEPPRPRKRNPAIPRDLETIVLKAIARDPGHRYASAGDLAEDLGRFLDDRPVVARRASGVERLARWCRRNKAVAALSATALVLLGLAAGVGWIGYASTSRALDRESLRRDEAEKATARAEENVALSLEAIEDLFNRLTPRDPGPPDRPAPGDDRPPPPGPGPPGPFGGPGPPQEGAGPPEEDEAGLIQSVLSFYERFAAKNATNTHLEREAARAYRRVADIQCHLGDDDAAVKASQRAAELFEVLLRHEPTDSGIRYELAAIYAAIEPDPGVPSALAETERSLQRALTLCDPNDGDDEETTGLRARIHVKLGSLQGRAGRALDAEKNLRRGLTLEESLVDGRAYGPFHLIGLADARQSLADFLTKQGHRDEARTLLLQCREELETTAAREPRDRTHLRVLVPRYARLADGLADVGEAELSEEVTAEIRDLRPLPQRFPGPPDHEPGPHRPPPPPGP